MTFLTRTDAVEDGPFNLRAIWWDFDGVDCPHWLDEDKAHLFCGLLNSYIPQEYSTKGCRYHILNHFKGGMYFHLLNRPVCLDGR